MIYVIMLHWVAWTNTILTECTWLRPETTCHMIYHISLARAPLGLNGQIDTEQNTRRKWGMKKTSSRICMQRHKDNMIWMATATSKNNLRAASHQHNKVCNREFGGSCAALSPWQSQSRWVLEWRYCPRWSTEGFQAVVNKIMAHFKWCIQLKGNRFFLWSTLP